MDCTKRKKLGGVSRHLKKENAKASSLHWKSIKNQFLSKIIKLHNSVLVHVLECKILLISSFPKSYFNPPGRLSTSNNLLANFRVWAGSPNHSATYALQAKILHLQKKKQTKKVNFGVKDKIGSFKPWLLYLRSFKLSPPVGRAGSVETCLGVVLTSSPDQSSSPERRREEEEGRRNMAFWRQMEPNSSVGAGMAALWDWASTLDSKQQ